jgi:hypothetical protein
MRSFVFPRFFIFFIILILLLASLVALLPTIISTEWGTRQTTAIINRFIPGKVEIKKLNIHWGHGQLAEGIALYDPKGHSVLGLDKFSTEATLWQLIRGSTHLGYTQLQDLNASIVTDEKGISNLQLALGTPIKGYYRVIPPSTILLSNINADLYLFTQEIPLAAHLTGSTKQGDLVGTFDIDTSLKGLQFSHWNELSRDAQKFLSIEGSKEAQVKAKIVNFPVDLLDRLVALKKPELNGIFRAILGDKFNLTADKEPSFEGLAFNISLLSPLMQGDVKGKISQGEFSLQEPGIFHFNLTPELLNPIVKQRFQLLDQTRLEVIFDTLSFPLSFLEGQAPVDPCLLGFKAHTQLQHSQIEVFPLGEMKILDFKVALESLACEKTISVHAIGKGQQGQEPFNIQFESTLNKPTTFRELISQLKKQTQSTLTINHLPIDLFNSYLGNRPGMVKALIGSHLDIALAINTKENESTTLMTNLQTESIAIKQAQFKIGKEIYLTAPMTIQCLLSNEVGQLMGLENVVLEKPCPLIATIQQLTLPLSSAQLDRGKIQANVLAPLVEISKKTSIGSIQLHDLQLKIEGRSLSQVNAQLFTRISGNELDNPYLLLMGNRTQLHMTSNLKFHPTEGLEISQIKTKIEGQNALVQAEGKMTPTYNFILTAPLEMKYQLTPETLQGLKIANLNQIHLKNSPWIHLKANPFQFNLKDMNLALLTIEGLLDLDRLDLQDAIGNLAILEQLSLPWTINGPANSIRLNLKGLAHTDHSQKPSQLAANLTLERWLNEGQYDLTHLKIETETHLIGVPVSLFNTLISKGDLTPLLGSSLDIELKTLIDSDQQAPGYWDMNIDSSHFHAKARLKFGQAITLYEAVNNAADLRWTLTPEGYQHLKQMFSESTNRSMTLLEPITFKGTLSQLYLPLNTGSFLKEGKVQIELATNETKWKELTNPAQSQSIKMNASLQSDNLADHFSFVATLSNHEAALVHLNGSVAQWIDQEGAVALKQANMKIDFNAKGLPTPMIRPLLFLDLAAQKKLEVVIGEHLDAQVRLELNQMNGTILSEIQSNRSYASLDGQIKQGILILNKPLEWEIQVTSALSKAFLSESIPFFSTAFSSDEPIKLIIEPQGFSIPFIPFELNKATIQKGKILLGKVHFYNAGDLNNLLNILKPVSSDRLTIWFTPLYFQMNQGKFIAKRVDMLIAYQYPLASWGTFDLNSRQLNMVLGLNAQSLKSAFNIQGLDSNSMLQIPIVGNNGDIQLDKKKATARISALMAQSQGSAEGRLLGTLLEFVASDNYLDSHPPSPTTQPFPWHNEVEEEQPIVRQQPSQELDQTIEEHLPQQISENSSDSKKHRKKKSKDSVLKEIGKEASSYLLEFLNK